MPVEMKINNLGERVARLAIPERAEKEKPCPRIAALDGLRGLAVLLVIFCHCRDPLNVTAHSQWTVQLLDTLSVWAGCGVDLFFVLSGFLITGALLKSKTTKHYFRNFYARRALRIFPLYYAALLGLFVLSALFRINTIGGTVDWVFLLLYMTNIVQTLQRKWSFGPAGQFWSLSVEEHFYFVWPLMIKFLSERRLFAVCISGIVIAPLFRYLMAHSLHDLVGAHVFTPCRMDGLLIGAFLALLLRYRHLAQLQKGACVLFACMAILGIAAIIYAPITSELRKIVSPSIFGVMFGALLIKTLNPSLLSSLFETKVMRAFGRYSYCLYVVHFPLARVVQPHWHIAGAPVLVNWALFFAFILACSVGISALSFRFFESRFLRMKDLFN